GNKPIVEHLIAEMSSAGIKEFILVVGYHAETIRQHFGNGERSGVKIEYVTQRKQLGTAHALSTVEGLVGDRFLLANGDVLIKSSDIERISSANETTLGLFEVEDARSFGAVELEGDRVARIHEKVENPPSNLANAGLYLLTGDIFPALNRTKKSPRGEYELTDSLQLMMNEGYVVKGSGIDNWLDLSYPWDLLSANEALLPLLEEFNQGTVEQNVVIKGKVSIGKGTVIRSNCYLVGPMIIGDNCDIGPNCYIRPSTTIGDNCHIGSAVEVKNSIIMRGSKAPHHNYVGDSIIGEDCNLGAGTKVANLRLDKKNIVVSGVDTRRHKLGAIIGDGVQTGINASINVGSLIGDGSYIGPGAVASGVILPNSRIT
ncbi:MAG: glucose-1-phosphate thymidylyltransferase, partial [Chloroflexi bacterium]|nr:glucose-1-phosphate thymidylyltransferase [Chloroflexota bacterium]